LLALRIHERCRALAILCHVWDAHQPADTASLVLVTPESAVTGVLLSFIHRLRTTERLERVVVGGCRLIADE
jgi:hypothetical protein